MLKHCAGELEGIMDLFDDSVAYGLNIDVMQLLDASHCVGTTLVGIIQPPTSRRIKNVKSNPDPPPRHTLTSISTEAPPAF